MTHKPTDDRSEPDLASFTMIDPTLLALGEPILLEGIFDITVIAARFIRRCFSRRLAGATMVGVLLAVTVVTAAASPAMADQTLRIGVQKYGTLVILRERHTLEPLLQKLGWSVRWTEFPGGPQLLEALNVGELDFGTAGEAPPVFAQAAGAPLVYVGVEPPSPKGEAILVPEASPIHAVADLRGKRVALNKGSNVHFLLVQALKSAGLTPTDIEPVYLAPADARAAFEQGAVDAWVIWDPFFAAGQAATKARVLTDAVGLAPNRQYFLATKTFADTRPALLKTLLDQIGTTDRWAEQHQDEVAKILEPSLKLPLPVIATALARMGYGVGPMTADVAADQQRIADTFRDLRLIPVSVKIADALWSPPS
jgi:sulfonate transport system substrate-binding protein